MGSLMRAIKNYDTFTTIKKIHKGWSTDEKYYVETDEGNRLLLRISDVSMIDDKKHEAMMVHYFSRVGLPVARVIDYGICGNGRKVYVLMTWCEGEDAADVLPTLSNNNMNSVSNLERFCEKCTIFQLLPNKKIGIFDLIVKLI